MYIYIELYVLCILLMIDKTRVNDHYCLCVIFEKQMPRCKNDSRENTFRMSRCFYQIVLERSSCG